MKTQLQLGFGLAGLAALALVGAACGSSNGGGTGGAGGSNTDGGAGHTGIGGKLGGTGGGSGLGGSGVGGAVCTATPYSHTTGFDGTFDGYSVPATNPTGSLSFMPNPDGGTPTAGTIQTLDTVVGSTAPGSARLEVPFSGPIQQLLFAQNFAPPLNLTGTTVTAQVRLDSGVFGDPVLSVVKAFLVLKSGPAYTYATGPAVNLSRSTTGFTPLTVTANTPDMLPLDYNPCDIREIDVEFDTGPMGTYTTGVIHIDDIKVSGGAIGDGGTDASDASDTSTASDAPVSTPDVAPDTTAPSDAAATDTSVD